jgi:hypothetical protein
MIGTNCIAVFGTVPCVHIPISRGQVAIVDLDDYHLVAPCHWIAAKNILNGAFYVISKTRERHGHWMHRVIMGLERDNPLSVDHKNRNPLDNRRENLRIATLSQNVMNKPAAANQYGFRGVRKNRTSFYGTVSANGKREYTKSFATPEEAARAYDELATKLHGEFAFLNFSTTGEPKR